MMKISKKQAEDQLRKDAKQVTEEDLKTVLEKEDELASTFSKQEPLKRFVDDLKLMVDIIRAYVKGEYKAIPFWTIASIIATLLYVLCPIDLIPDYIPIFGYVDDGAVVAACLRLIEKDLIKYKKWKGKV